MLGRELFTSDEVRKLDNKKCRIFIRGFDPIMDNKYIPFVHPMFNQTADGKGKPFEYDIADAKNVIGSTYEILTERALKHYETMKEKGENVYIDSLTYEQFMLLGDMELNRRFMAIEEREQINRINHEQQRELEYAEELGVTSETSSDTTGGQSVANRRQINREKPKWDDTISNRILHWNYSEEQKQAMVGALKAGVSKQDVLKNFYSDVNSTGMKKCWIK